ncbi:nascent polypeptide-associated complex, alpha subunit [Tilletiopsis washingtonensis]|uniref:Nascent polypeptide-associated complex subunit alpha n=1 Tax=Tilletiopsis washingtonensis TaxID=58919 RepID=A0A316Z446_9BASI|nr:nascent polypeptide-associated complex, alpha subunit [Tilletiopsis washingtonensis]PWN96331.1 nascent polypeptide-associated complex, alpha subunit [Tilletiopsis washingtonensis]
MSASIEEIADDVQDLQVESDVEASGATGGDVTIGEHVTSKPERKARKSLQNIGLKKVQGITRVTMRRPRGHLYVISTPEVYKSASADVYIVFGEAKSEDQSMAAQQAQAAQIAQQEAQQDKLLADSFAASQAQSAGAGKEKEEKEEESDGEIDETGVDAKDIDLVMQQVSCSRRKAVKALKETNGDLINAIMNAS